MVNNRVSREKKKEEVKEKLRLEAKKAKTRSTLLKVGVLLGALIIVVIIGLIVVSSQQKSEDPTSGPLVYPQGTAQTGIVVGKDNKIEAKDATKNLIVVYQDYLCPACQAFEAENSSYLEEQRNSGKVQVEYIPLGYLDRLSNGSNYSSRSANAATCVADLSPDKFIDYSNSLYEKQPQENTTGLTNSQLAQMGKDVGTADIQKCTSENQFRPWVAKITDQAKTDNVTVTPTLVVNGKTWDRSTSFQQFAAANLK